jgi:hypothetical protein
MKLGQHGGKECGALHRYKECNKMECGCSHVKCHLKDNTKFSRKLEEGGQRNEVWSIMVSHDRQEQKGDHHVCGYDR